MYPYIIGNAKLVNIHSNKIIENRYTKITDILNYLVLEYNIHINTNEQQENDIKEIALSLNV